MTALTIASLPSGDCRGCQEALLSLSDHTGDWLRYDSGGVTGWSPGMVPWPQTSSTAGTERRIRVTMRLRTEGGVTFFDLPEWEVRGARAIYSTRRGGVSEGPYSQLNIGFHVGDDPAAVAENRRRLATATEMPLASWVLGEQVHGCAVRVVGQSQRGAGAWEMKSALPASDALIGHQPGLVLGVHTAD